MRLNFQQGCEGLVFAGSEDNPVVVGSTDQVRELVGVWTNVLEINAATMLPEALALQHFHECGNFPHIGDRRRFNGRVLAFGALVVHLPFGFHCLSASTPAPAVALGRSEQGSFVWRVHHDARPLIYLRSLPLGCTTYGPGQHPAARRSRART